MAFFKFRLPGQNAVASAEGSSAGSADSLEVVRRRKRELIEKECSGLIEFIDLSLYLWQ